MSVESNITNRQDADALIPEEESREILDQVIASSFLINEAGNTIQMSRKQTRLPVIGTVVSGGWVDGDTGVKAKSQNAWRNVFLNAEAHAVIVPVPEDVVEDMDEGFWERTRPQIAAAFARELDKAALFRANGEAPSSWPEGLAVQAHQRGAFVPIGSNAAKNGGFAGDVSDAFERLETSGFDPNLALAHTGLRAKARNTRDADGRQLAEIGATEWYGTSVQYPARGLWNPVTYGSTTFLPRGVVVDTSQLAFGLRSDISYKILDQATVTIDNQPVNLAERDMVAIRAVGRFAFAVANHFRYDEPMENVRAFASVLVEQGNPPE